VLVKLFNRAPPPPPLCCGTLKRCCGCCCMWVGGARTAANERSERCSEGKTSGGRVAPAWLNPYIYPSPWAGRDAVAQYGARVVAIQCSSTLCWSCPVFLNTLSRRNGCTSSRAKLCDGIAIRTGASASGHPGGKGVCGGTFPFVTIEGRQHNWDSGCVWGSLPLNCHTRTTEARALCFIRRLPRATGRRRAPPPPRRRTPCAVNLECCTHPAGPHSHSDVTRWVVE